MSLNGNERPVTDIKTDGTNLIFTVEGTNSADASGSATIVFVINNETITKTFEYDGTKPCKI